MGTVNEKISLLRQTLEKTKRQTLGELENLKTVVDIRIRLLANECTGKTVPFGMEIQLVNSSFRYIEELENTLFQLETITE